MAVATREMDPPPDEREARQQAPSKKRRRPSGEAPPLPRQLRTSGKYWLVLSVLAFIGWVVIFFVEGVGQEATKADLWVGASPSCERSP